MQRMTDGIFAHRTLVMFDANRPTMRDLTHRILFNDDVDLGTIQLTAVDFDQVLPKLGKSPLQAYQEFAANDMSRMPSTIKADAVKDKFVYYSGQEKPGFISDPGDHYAFANLRAVALLNPYRNHDELIDFARQFATGFRGRFYPDGCTVFVVHPPSFSSSLNSSCPLPAPSRWFERVVSARVRFEIEASEFLIREVPPLFYRV